MIAASSAAAAFTFLLDGIDLGLGSVQDIFQNSLTADIPFIGTHLADAGQLIGNLRAGLLTDLRGKLAGPGKPIELARDALFNTFSGLGILLDTNVTKVEF